MAVPFLAASFTGCAKEEPPPQPIVRKPIPKKTAEAVVAQAATDNAAPVKAPVTSLYNPEGKRDPFVPFIKPAAKTAPTAEIPAGPPSLLTQDLGAFKYVGLIWTGRGVRGLIEDAEGRGYTVTVGSKLGRGSAVVIRINEKEIVVKEAYQDYTGATIVRESPLKLKSAGGK
jgi:Tfp pilus assembly protein PilP